MTTCGIYSTRNCFNIQFASNIRVSVILLLYAALSRLTSYCSQVDVVDLRVKSTSFPETGRKSSPHQTDPSLGSQCTLPGSQSPFALGQSVHPVRSQHTHTGLGRGSTDVG